MPSRKQRRRRQKERRHEYEYVYVDEEGHEVEVEPEVRPEAGRRDRKQDRKPAPAKGRSNRPVRQVQPPSWTRVGRRALLFFPLIFIAFSLVNKHQALGTRVFVTAVYTAFFVPFMYLMDRAMYRAYLKRSGQSAPRSGKRR
jgi:hypothetical protein